MADETRPNIYSQLADICARLGLEPKNVRELTITAPGDAVATVYLLRDGHKYVDADGRPATEKLTFKVRTYA